MQSSKSCFSHLTQSFLVAQVSRLRQQFDKSKEIDASNRSIIVSRLKSIKIVGPEVSADLAAKFVEATGAKKASESFSNVQTMIKLAGYGASWGKTTCNVRTDLEDAVAFFWDIHSRAHKNGNVKSTSLDVVDTLERNVRRVDVLDSKHGGMHGDRIFLSKMKVHRIHSDNYVITIDAIEGNQTDVSNATEHTALSFKKVRERETKIEMVALIELGQRVSTNAVKAYLLKYLGQITRSAHHFHNILSSDIVTTADARHFAEELMHNVKRKGKTKQKIEVVKEFIAMNEALNEMIQKYDFMEAMLCEIVENKLRSTVKVDEKAECLEEKDGRNIGRGLAITLASTLTASHGVEEWALQYPAVQELEKDYKWLRHFLETISYKLMGEVRWGVKARVAVGAGTSMLDLLTDIYVTVMFARDPNKQGYFKASLASLAASIGFQLLFVLVLYKKLGKKRVLRELIPVLIGFKPALDAFRVATGLKEEYGQIVSPMVEMTLMKIVELFAEAIPGVVIQLMAIATTKKEDEISTSAIISLVVSILTAGFISATISYDWDTNPVKRQQIPEYYGYVPALASKRTTVFVSMMLMSAGLLLIRCTTIVLLGLFEKRWAFTYIGADVGLYMLVRVLRGDFWYWFPVGGEIEIVVSILCRVLVKSVSDFTSIVF